MDAPEYGIDVIRLVSKEVVVQKKLAALENIDAQMVKNVGRLEKKLDHTSCTVDITHSRERGVEVLIAVLSIKVWSMQDTISQAGK